MKHTHALLCAVPICLALSLSLAPMTLAAAPVPPSVASEITHAVDPRYDHISRISSGMTISTSGYASCTGSYTMYQGMDGTITVTLQRFENNRWTDFQDNSKDFSGDGPKVFQTGWDVSTGLPLPRSHYG